MTTTQDSDDEDFEAGSSESGDSSDDEQPVRKRAKTGRTSSSKAQAFKSKSPETMSSANIVEDSAANNEGETEASESKFESKKSTFSIRESC